MIYDEKKHYDLVYNENQTLGYFSNFLIEYAHKSHEQFLEASNGKPIVRVNNLIEFGIGVLVLVFSVILGEMLRFLLPCGNSVVFHTAAAFICGFVGILSLTSNKPTGSHQYYIDITSRRLTGGLLLIEAVLIPLMWFNLPFETDWECNYFMAGVFFVVMGLYNVISLLMFFTRKMRVYTRSVDAECIGYLRYRSSINAAEQSRANWYHTPVYRYFLDGQEIVAFCDTLTRGINAKIPLGPCTINVNKDDPGSVMNPSKKGVIGISIVAVILICLGVSLIIGVLNGGVDGTSISF